MNPLSRRTALAAFPALLLGACNRGGGVGGDQVRAYLLEHPEVIEEAMTKLQEKRQAAADTQLRQALSRSRDALERDPRDYVAGNPNGKITVVEFFDYRCPYCKAARPAIAKLLAENKDIRFVMKEYPILSPASEAAARAAIGAKAQGKYWPVHEGLMAAQTLDEPTIMQVLQSNGVDLKTALEVGTGAQTTKLLDDVRQLARSTGVSGTPAFVIGQRMVAGWMPEDIQKAIQDARKAA